RGDVSLCRGPILGGGKDPSGIPEAVGRALIETSQNFGRTSGSDTRKSACRKRCLEESTIQAAERNEIHPIAPPLHLLTLDALPVKGSTEKFLCIRHFIGRSSSH